MINKLTNNELTKLIEDFCICILDDSKGPPPYICLSDKEIAFFERYKDELKWLYKLTPAQVIVLLDVVDEHCQIHFKAIIDSGTENSPYQTIPDHNSANEYNDLLEDYCFNKLKIVYPQILKLVVEKISIKSREVQNICQYNTISRRRDIDNKANSYDKALVEITKKISEAQDNLDEWNSTYQKLQKDVEEVSNQYENIQIDYNSLKSDFNTLESNYHILVEEYDKMSSELNKAEKTMLERTVTVLGIFSAIVLTFNAGVSFSSIVLETLIQSSVYRAIIITLIFGLILGNAIVGLFAYLEYVRKKQIEELKHKTANISSKRRHPDENKINEKSKTKIVMITLNAIIVGLISLTLIFWWFGIVEIRNQKQFGECNTPETTISSETEEDSDNVISGKFNVNLHSEETE